jgi:diguanylate cyclase (GGDEF)-like protein
LIVSPKFAVLSVLALTSAFLIALIAAARRRAHTGGKTGSFAGLCAAGLIYSLGYMQELISPDLSTALLAIRIEYVGIALLPALLLMVVRHFEDNDLKRMPVFLYFVIPAITLVFVFTMNLHKLYYIQPTVKFENGLTLLSFGRGPAYWVFTLYKYAAVAYGILAFARFSARGPRSKRLQARYMLAGCLLPMVANLFYLARIVPYGLDPSPLAFAFTSFFFAIGFFRYHLLDILPVARDTVFEQMRDAVLVTDDEGRIVDVNESALNIFPTLTEQHRVHHIGELKKLVDVLPKRSEESEMTITLSLPEGKRHYDLHRSVLLNRYGKPVGSAHVFMDVTDRTTMEAKLATLATTDELTDVPNRRSFFERAQAELERAERYGRPFGVAILDLNNFKAINDRYGHAAGDEALRLAAHLCAETLRSADIMGRYGGDEFAFAFPECDESEARDAAKRLASILASAVFPFGEALIPLSASVGAAGASGPPLPELEDLLKLADERMYEQKGRATSCASRKQGPAADSSLQS